MLWKLTPNALLAVLTYKNTKYKKPIGGMLCFLYGDVVGCFIKFVLYYGENRDKKYENLFGRT